ncbi:MAG: redoxin domain-containing protein [Candidatus Heimdallarchaeota archaeon]|nr:MAG: redoxin domain-containing protein [Candidatus Heimdallarchaeota archaeon]
MKNKWITLLILMVLSPLTIVNHIELSSSYPTSSTDSSQLSIGTTAPDFTLTDIMTGETFSLTDFEGKVVILDLFATWCGPCEQAIPKLRDIHRCYSDDELTIISVDVDEDEGENVVRDYIIDHDMEWLVSLDTNSVIDDNYGSGYIPTMYIIDHNQIIAYSEIGFDIEEIIETLDQLSLEPLTPLPEYASIDEIPFFTDVVTPLLIVIGIGFTIFVVVYLWSQQRKRTEAYQAHRYNQFPSVQKGGFLETCPKCGHSLSFQAFFCPYCGSDFKEFFQK